MRGLLVLAALTACGSGEPGALGRIEFTPRDCGRPTCTFEESIAADSVLTIDLAPAEDDVSLDGIALDVEGAGVTQDSSTSFEVEFGGDGTVLLVVVGPDGEEIDHLEVTIETAHELSLELDDGDAGGPEETGLHDEVWTLAEDEAASFYVTPLTRAGEPLMGRFDYTQISTSLELEAEINADVADGHFEVSLLAGEHWTIIRNAHLADVDVLFDVE